MNRLTDQAFVVLVHFARSGPGATWTARSVAEALDLPVPTAAKVLKILGRTGLLASTRGLCGGYQLAADPDQTTVRRVIEAVEGPLAMTECSLPQAITCETHTTCSVGRVWPAINEVIVSALDRVTLADLVRAQAPERTRSPVAEVPCP
jgi:FeS assembly SUF system regulator